MPCPLSSILVLPCHPDGCPGNHLVDQYEGMLLLWESTARCEGMYPDTFLCKETTTCLLGTGQTNHNMTFFMKFERTDSRSPDLQVFGRHRRKKVWKVQTQTLVSDLTL